MHPVGIPYYVKLRTKFEVSSSNIFQDILDRLPENLGVRWPRPRPFWGKLFVRPLGFTKTKLLTKFEVCVPTSFEDMFDYAKNLWVTWHRPRPFGEKFCIFLCKFANF